MEGGWKPTGMAVPQALYKAADRIYINFITVIPVLAGIQKMGKFDYLRNHFLIFTTKAIKRKDQK